MKYSKPELLHLGSTEVIQGTSKQNGCIFDSSEPLKTCAAYEADE